MQYPGGDESGKEEDEADAHVAVAVDVASDSDEVRLEEVRVEEARSVADDYIEAGSGGDVVVDAPAAGSESPGDLDVQDDEADDGATDSDEEVDDDEDPADHRRANLVVAASFLLAVIVVVAATMYAPPPPDTPSAPVPGPVPTMFPTGDFAFATFPRGGTATANDNDKEWNARFPIPVNFQMRVAPGARQDLQTSALLRRFFSIAITSVLHMLYFWHHLGVLDLVLLPLVWVLLAIILYSFF